MQKKGYAVVAIALLLAGLLPAVGLVAPPPIPPPVEVEPVEEVHSFGYATTAAHPAAANITRLQISPSHKHVRLQPGEEEEFTVNVKNMEDEAVNVRPQVVIPPYGEHFAEEDWITVTPSSAELPDAFSGKYHNSNAQAMVEDAIKSLMLENSKRKKAFSADKLDFGIIGVAEAKDIRYNSNFWYDNGKDGDFSLSWLDAGKKGPPDEACWQAYKDGWYDWYLKWLGDEVPKDKVLTRQEFEKVLPRYLIGSVSDDFDEWPPKNANGYQPKVKLILTNPKEEKRAILKLDIAPIWKYAYGWWPDGPNEGENIDLEFVDNPINAMYSAEWSSNFALLSTDKDEFPELIAVKEGPTLNWFGVIIPTFIEGGNGVYTILPRNKWKNIHVTYDAVDKDKRYPELYEKLREAGFEYLGEVYTKDLINGIVFDIQEPPPSLIIEKAEKPVPSPEMPTSEGLVVPTITSEQMPSPTPESNAGETPGFGIGEVLASLTAAGIATLKIRKKK